ncbi:MAG: hypothetical protein ACRDGE_11595 [Candidatus Limnocylindria bacterium]
MTTANDTIRRFLLIEGVAFILAGLIHFGVGFTGYENSAAARPETVIGTVLLVALALSWAFPAATRGLAIAAQAFALLGTLVGIYGIYLTIIGIGRSTVLDIAFNIGILLTLIAGLIVAVRAGRR